MLEAMERCQTTDRVSMHIDMGEVRHLHDLGRYLCKPCTNAGVRRIAVVLTFR